MKCKKCHGTKFEFVEDFTGTISNPITNGKICFDKKDLDGDTDNSRIICSKCGKEVSNKLFKKIWKG